jgi:hypothetical protein
MRHEGTKNTKQDTKNKKFGPGEPTGTATLAAITRCDKKPI